MRTILWTSALLTMVLTVGADGVVEDQLGEQSSPAPQSKQKEFHYQGPCQVTVSGWPWAPPRCPQNPYWASFDMTSESDDVPHLGYTVLTGSACVAMDPWIIPDGEAVFTAANGDTLTATFWGWPSWAWYWCETWLYLPMEITGGTGRFQNATGSLYSVIDALYDDACEQVVSCTLTINGTFSY